MVAECTVSILQHSALAPSNSRRREVTRVVCVNICILRDFHAAIINLHTEASLSLTKYPTLTSHQTAPPTSPLIPHTSHLTPHLSYLTPHTPLLTPHLSYLTPHFSLLTPLTSHLRTHTNTFTDNDIVKQTNLPY